MNNILLILAIYSLSFFIRNLSGPYNIFGIFRNKILNNKYIGVQFYKLLECPWCLGFHCGYIIYILNCLVFKEFSFILLILWGLVGSTVTAIFDSIFNKVQEE